MGYFKSVIDEMKQVTWPKAKEVHDFTWIVLLLIVVFGAYFLLTDTIFSSFLDWLVSL